MHSMGSAFLELATKQDTSYYAHFSGQSLILCTLQRTVTHTVYTSVDGHSVRWRLRHHIVSIRVVAYKFAPILPMLRKLYIIFC